MEKKQGVKGRRLLFALFLTGAVLLGLAGCSENIGGTVYLSGVSRLRMELSATQEVTEVAGLNRDGSTMADGLSWRDKTGTEMMDELIPLLCEEEPSVVYVDVFSDDKDWEEQLVTEYTERYGTDGTENGEAHAVPVEVRRVTDLDEVGAAALQAAETENTEAETSGAAEESESTSEDGTEAEETAASEETSDEGEDTSDAAESEAEAEPEEDEVAESSEAAARSAGTAAARETETTAARETETAAPTEAAAATPSPETSAAPLETEPAAPAETEAPVETEAEAAEVTESQESQENQEAAAEEVPEEEASGSGTGNQSRASGQGASGTANQGQGVQRSTEENSLVGGEVPYGPGW